MMRMRHKNKSSFFHNMINFSVEKEKIDLDRLWQTVGESYELVSSVKSLATNHLWDFLKV